MSTGDRQPRIEEIGADDSPDALDRLLAEIRVPVDRAASRQIMSRLPAADWRPRRSARGEWAIAAALVAMLAALAAVLVSGGESSAGGVGTSIVDLVVTAVAAGAGFLAASWHGLGAAVDAALDGSVTALLALGLAALAANGLLLVLLRRRRSAVRSRDDS
jgi:hypothetical protein